MATIKVHCTNPIRKFELNSIGTDIQEFSKDIIAYNAALIGIVGLCDDIYYCCSERIGDSIVIAPSYIKDECFSLTKLVRCVKKYKPDAFDNVLESQLYLMRLVNDYFFKTELERAYLAEKYDAFDAVVEKTKTAAVSYLSSVFDQGVVSISSDDNNKLVYVPQGELISLLNVSEDELFQGVKLICENHEVALKAQDLRDICNDMMIAANVSSYDDEDDRKIVLTNAVTRGIITSMLYDN